MCGIIGMIHYSNSGFDYHARNAWFPMLLLNSMRGAHSTGMFGVDPEYTGADRVEWVKRVGNPYWLAMEKSGKEFLERIFNRYSVVIGHGRYATQGKVNAANAHPFQHGNITLVHNGSIRNFYTLKHGKEHLQSKFEVDSEALTYLISEVGPHEAMEQVEGAFAVMWHDAEKKCIYALRNDERPLYVAVREKPGGLFFSSEAPTLDYVASRFGEIKFEDGGAKYLAPGFLYKFPLGDDNENVMTKEKIKIGRPFTVAPYKGRKNYNSTDFMGYGDMHDLFNDPPALTELERTRAAAEEAAEKAIGKEKGSGVIPFRQKGTAEIFKQEEKDSKNTAKIKEIRRFGMVMRVGGMIAFYPSSIEPIGDKGYFIHGDSADSEHVSVACHYSGPLSHSDIKDTVVMAGKIMSIVYLGSKKSAAQIRVYIKDLTQLHPKVQNKLIQTGVKDLEEEMKKTPFDPADPDGDRISVKVKNGDMSFTTFEMYQARGCAKCHGQIAIEDAPNCVLEHSGKDSQYGGLICPDCAIHRILH